MFLKKHNAVKKKHSKEVSHCQIKLTFLRTRDIKKTIYDIFSEFLIYRRIQCEHSLVCRFSLLSWKYLTRDTSGLP